jgi:hypothetical protein
MGQHQVGVADREVLAQVGLTRLHARQALDEAGALKVLTSLGSRYLK